MIVIVLSIFSAFLFSTSLIVLISCRKIKRVPCSILIPLALTLLFYALVAASNLAEHSGLSGYFDPLEDVMEILFSLVFLFFINNWNYHKTIHTIKEKNTWLHVTLDSIPDGVLTCDNAGKITHINPAMEKMTGIPLSQACNAKASDLLVIVDRKSGETKRYDPVNTIGPGEHYSSRLDNILLRNRDGHTIAVTEKTTAIRDEGGAIIGTVGIFSDMSEYESMSAQLTHIHKMEAIGQLAGGVAHDLNNMLGGIIGAAEVLKLGDRDKLNENQHMMIDLILTTSARAAELTKNLLAFSRKGKIISTSVNIKDIINATIVIAQHTLDRQIVIETDISDEPIEVTGDPGQLQNAILNLLLNARDAINGSGKIRIGLHTEYLDDAYCSLSKQTLTAGMYAAITIEDDGSGIPEEILDKIFEPFFTTKKEGKGTGLGLSAVYGTVISHHGSICVKSEPGKGSHFTLHIPSSGRTTCLQTVENSSVAAREPDGGTILIIEDEDVLRTTARLMIQDLGYSVLSACDGPEGIETYQQNKTIISAVLLDMVMPKMNGFSVFKALKQIDPSVKIILSSGFLPDGSIPVAAENFIQKPYRINQLAQVIRDVLAKNN